MNVALNTNTMSEEFLQSNGIQLCYEEFGPDSDVSGTSAKHSRLKSSTTARMRKRLPSVNASLK
ncbi:MAG: hypothetical protein AAF197_07440, partial [Pseudomonadota bacterium]